MGIYIYFTADESRIERKAWKKTFDDALLVAQAGGLCSIEKREFEGNAYYPGVLAKPEGCGDENGMEIKGELVTGSTMETHFIPRTFGVERPVADIGESMLTFYLGEPEQYGLTQPDAAWILYNKTQGTPAHIYLLAMACVFCDAFPDATSLTGDITAGQVFRAVRIAEEVLGRRINPPVAYDMEKLLPRVQALAKGNEVKTAKLFFAIYKGLRDDDFNRFVAEHFSRETLYTMFCNRAANESIHGIMKEWLLLDLPFADVARMLVADPEGPRHEPEKVVKSVLNAKLHLENKNSYDAAYADNRNEEPDDVKMQFSRAMAIMFGVRNFAVDRFIPMPQLKADCTAVFGESVDVDALFSEAQAALDADEHRRDAEDLYEMIDKSARERITCDIWEMKDMFDWMPDASTDPKLLTELEDFLKQAYEVTTDTRVEFCGAGRDRRIQMLTRLGGDRYLLSQERWNAIFESVMDDAKMVRYVTLFGIRLSGDGIREMAQVLLYNSALYDEIWSRVFDEA